MTRPLRRTMIITTTRLLCHPGTPRPRPLMVITTAPPSTRPVVMPGMTSTPATASPCSATSSGSRLLLTIPTLVWGHMLQTAFGYHAPMFPGATWIPAVFGTAVFVYGGWPFVQGARREIQDRLPGMMTLIALAISVAFVFSAVVTLGYPGMPLWEELATLVTIMLLGHWLEMRSISQAQGALGELAKLLPNTATRVVGRRRRRADRGRADRRGARGRRDPHAPRRERPGGWRGPLR